MQNQFRTSRRTPQLLKGMHSLEWLKYGYNMARKSLKCFDLLNSFCTHNSLATSIAVQICFNWLTNCLYTYHTKMAAELHNTILYIKDA